MTRFSERLREHDANGRLLNIWDEFSSQVARDSADSHSKIVHGHETFTGNRTTRRRWVNGEMRPRCQGCVQTLAELLDDGSLLDYWIADNEGQDERRAFNDAVTRISGLPPQLKRKLQEQLRIDIQPSEFSTRESVHVSVRINPLTLALHHGEVAIRWRGRVPKNAKVCVTPNREGLMAAFADESCIYRDLLHLDPDELAHGYERLALRRPDRPIAELSVKPTSESSWTKLRAASLNAPGCFEFPTRAIEDAEIRLTMVFPCSARYTCYPIQFGSYRVRGVARMSFKLDDAISGDTPKLLVLPPDCATFVDDEQSAVSIELGEEGSLLPAATTVFFYWAPKQSQDRADEAA